MKNTFKKLAVAAAVALPSFAVFAEPTDGTDEFDAATSIITPVQQSLEGILGAAGGAVASVLLVGLAIWGGIAVVGLIKRSFNAGKGR